MTMDLASGALRLATGEPCRDVRQRTTVGQYCTYVSDSGARSFSIAGISFHADVVVGTMFADEGLYSRHRPVAISPQEAVALMRRAEQEVV
jgi:hypothetical protein